MTQPLPSAVGLGDVPAHIDATSPRRGVRQRLRRDRAASAGLAVIALLVLVAVLAPLVVALVGAPGFAERDPSALDPLRFGAPEGPSARHLFGVTPDTGWDVFSRVIYGARVSLLVAFVATGLSALVGITIGLVAGFYRGWVDAVLSRLMDVALAFPIFLLAVGLASACTIPDASGTDGCLGGVIRPGLSLVIAVIVVSTWPYFARVIRGQVLSLREQGFVEAARALGAPDRRIIVREILPNLLAPIVVYATLLVPATILFEAALSFLGIGVQDPTPSWGRMIADAVPTFDSAWWYMLFPGLALLASVLAFNLVGDGLRDALDPRG